MCGRKKDSLRMMRTAASTNSRLYVLLLVYLISSESLVFGHMSRMRSQPDFKEKESSHKETRDQLSDIIQSSSKIRKIFEKYLKSYSKMERWKSELDELDSLPPTSLAAQTFAPFRKAQLAYKIAAHEFKLAGLEGQVRALGYDPKLLKAIDKP